MIKYKLQDEGVRDTELGMDIPEDPKNRHWNDFLVWQAAGNVPDPYIVPAHTGTMELTVLQTRLAACTQNTLVLDATGAGTITHSLSSLWYDLTTTPPLTQKKTTNTVYLSGGTQGERISYSIRLLIPEDLNHLLTRTP